MHPTGALGQTPPDYRFGPFTLQSARHRLLEDGAPVPLGRRSFDLLAILVADPGRLFEKHELLRRVWEVDAVEENNLTVAISSLRRALHGKALGQEFIQTVARRGYRFVGAVTVLPRQHPSIAAEMPSIAVLPFIDGQPCGTAPSGRTLFGAGIAEDITATLSRNRWLTVIAHRSAASFGDTPPGAAEVARELGVRYVLEGRVDAGDGTAPMHVGATLIDAATNTPLVAGRFEAEHPDIFTARDEIARLIGTAVRPALIEAEVERSIRHHPDSIDAWAACQRGSWHLARFDGPDTANAHAWFQRAMELDPQFAPGFHGRALAHLYQGSSWQPEADPHWQTRGEALALQAVILDDRDSGAFAVLGLARMVRGDHAGALQALLHAIALDPNDAAAHGTLGATLIFAGRHAEGQEALARSFRLSPRDPRLRIRRAHAGLGHFFARDFDAAEHAARAIMDEWPRYPFGARLLTIALASTGRLAEARLALRSAAESDPSLFDDYAHARMPWYRAEDYARVIDAMRAAGWAPAVPA